MGVSGCVIRRAFSFASDDAQYRTGTISMVIISMVMPPNEGIAIGTMMSDPRPFDVRTGSNARMVVAVVIRQGRIRRLPASSVAVRISETVSGARVAKESFR